MRRVLFRKCKHACRERWLRCILETSTAGCHEPATGVLCANMSPHSWLLMSDHLHSCRRALRTTREGLSQSVRRHFKLTDSWSLPDPHEPTAADLDAIAVTVSWCHCSGSTGGSNVPGQCASKPWQTPPPRSCRAHVHGQPRPQRRWQQP